MNYDTMVLYSSKTGNTKKIAMEIFSAVPGVKKDLIKIEEYSDCKEAETYLVGFWTDRGSCPAEVMNFLSSLSGKKVALFGTCGMGRNPEYYKEIEAKVSVWIPDDCEYLGFYMCQGKMPLVVREKYESMLTGANAQQAQKMIQNFDQAMVHPDQQDLDEARKFVEGLAL